MTTYRETLCFRCNNCYAHKCERFVPYTKRPLPIWTKYETNIIDGETSYLVIECKKFILDKKLHK